MKNFIKLEDDIKQILIDDERAKNDDMYLYAVYCEKKFLEFENGLIKKINLDDLRDDELKLFKEKFRNSGFMYDVLIDKNFRKTFKICTFTALIRVRRKVQAECPELESEWVKKARAKKEEEFKDYARL